jgi:short-subunit dehydrogenase
MLAKGSGTVINIAPPTSVMWLQERTGKGAFKSFTVAFTHHLYMEAEGTGVHVQLVVPGVVATESPAIAESDLSTLPPAEVITPARLVDASLRALALREPICCPLRPTIRDWDSYVKAERALVKAV